MFRVKISNFLKSVSQHYISTYIIQECKNDLSKEQTACHLMWPFNDLEHEILVFLEKAQ